MAIEQFSNHPLAGAIVQGLLKEFSISERPNAETVEEVAGYGVLGNYNDKSYRIGKLEHMTQVNDELVALANTWASKGMSLVYIQEDDVMVGVMGLVDMLRPQSKPLINWFKKQNIQTIMITGDNKETAEHIGKELGIDRILAETLPDDKVRIVRELEEEFETVIMIGDGINDAPALANASIGVAMGGGTDIAMEAADVILVKDNIASVGYAIELSQRLRKIVIQNIVFSFSVIILLVIANFFDKINLPIGVVGHEGSTILVILNSLRLLRNTSKTYK